MTSQLQSLFTLKLNTLKSLAVSIGVNSSGTKAQLAARITKSCCDSVGFFDRSSGVSEGVQEGGKGGHEGEIGRGQKKKRVGKRTKRVLSIDMGIRNLAICVIEVPDYSAFLAAEKKVSKPRRKTVSGALPKVIAWESMAVTKGPSETLETPETPISVIEKRAPKKGRRRNLNPDPQETVIPLHLAKTRKVRKVESFELAHYAILANTFVRTILSQFSPDAILIERQRYRSHGTSAVLEWTIRVNVFEAMLHATFYSVGDAKKENICRKSPAAESVYPDRVSRFWIDKTGEKYIEEEKKGKTNLSEDAKQERAYKKVKLAKISLVSEWIKSGDVMSLDKRLESMAENFIPKGGWESGEKLRRTVNGKKVDDLADCLLQGMAWIRWEENRRNFAEGRLIPEFLACNDK